MNKKTSVTTEFAGKTITYETGEIAPQATSAILARAGDTVVLATVVLGKESTLDYFPLSVEYAERLYAGGRIKGSRWVKREGRPSDEAVLIGRLIDRSIRPFFPKDYKREVQVMITILSVDGEHEPDILAMNAVSAALSISPIPWKGPICAIRVGFVRGENDEAEYLLNPTTTELSFSDLDLVVSQSREKTVMLEAGAKQVSEEIMLEAIKRAHAETHKFIAFIDDLVGKVGQQKIVYTPSTATSEMVKKIEKMYKDEVAEIVKTKATKERSGSEDSDLIKKIYDNEKTANPESEIDSKIIAKALEYVMFQAIRADVVKKNKRVDGRAMDEIREISSKVSVLPRTHGSALFNRGITQALTIATLGSPRMEQLIESAEGEESKRYIHHYSMPPYSVGEAGRMGFTSRREIGHGALAERALLPVIPTKDVFPYTIRLVSEITSSNGSTSMAATCGSTLALMDAGVPITKPVGGISVGMMSYPAGSANTGEYVLLTDIIGLEDFSGDMDFKVAGTDTGITAIQLDVKTGGLTIDQVKETLERAKVGRLHVLKKMSDVISQPRDMVSMYAPKIEVVQIPVEKIGELIGPGGKIIKNIIAITGAEVDVEDDGTVTIAATEEEARQKAVAMVTAITREVKPGEVFVDVPVKRILPFGAFVEILPGKEGMVHVSKMTKGFVQHPEDVVTIGQNVTVKVIEVDDQGRINLSMLLEENGEEEGQPEGPREPRPYQDRGPRSMSSAPRGRTYGNRSDVGRDRGGYGREERRDDSRSTHPLARQFQRERTQTVGPRRRTSAPRKAHY